MSGDRLDIKTKGGFICKKRHDRMYVEGERPQQKLWP
nr:MAG TPA: hypothetical protein [Caudoviricetes sp.]